MRYRNKPTDGYRSKFEARVADRLSKIKVAADYEVTKINYILCKTYTPDFTTDDGIYLEVKGVLDQQSRSKMSSVKEQHPDLDIRFVFMDPHKRCPGLKTTHAEWADKNGFLWYTLEDLTRKDLT